MDKPPAGLKAPGRRLWLSVAAWLAELDVTLDPHELELVGQMCVTADRLSWLRRAADAATDVDERLKLLREERQQGTALARLVTASGLPTGLVDESGGKPVGLSPKSRRAQRAARARWGERGAA